MDGIRITTRFLSRNYTQGVVLVIGDKMQKNGISAVFSTYTYGA